MPKSKKIQTSKSKYTEEILATLTEPRTPNEVALLIEGNQRTVQFALMELALAGKVKHKKIGRVYLFWK